MGGLTRVRLRAPVLGGNFAVWGMMFSIFDCTLTKVRKTEDAWNAIIAGGLTGGVLAARAGPRAMGRSALMGAMFLAVIEGFVLFISRFMQDLQQKQLREQYELIHGEPPPTMQADKLEPPLRPRRPDETARRAGSGELSGTEMLLGGASSSSSSAVATSPLASAEELCMYQGGASVSARLACAVLAASSQLVDGAREWADAARNSLPSAIRNGLAGGSRRGPRLHSSSAVVDSEGEGASGDSGEVLGVSQGR